MEIGTPGIYGKLPSYSDYITHELTAEITRFWHEWMRTVMYHTKDTMEENNWLSLYLVSPPWRFLITDQLLSEHPMMGVLLPSVDRVGRYFPFIIANRLTDDEVKVEWIFKSGSALLDIYEKAGIKALQARWSVEQIDNWMSQQSIIEIEKTSDEIPLPSSHYAVDLLSCLDHKISDVQIGSVWWTSYRTESLFVLEDMPTPETYAIMLGYGKDSEV